MLPRPARRPFRPAARLPSFGPLPLHDHTPTCITAPKASTKKLRYCAYLAPRRGRHLFAFCKASTPRQGKPRARQPGAHRRWGHSMINDRPSRVLDRSPWKRDRDRLATAETKSCQSKTRINIDWHAVTPPTATHRSTPINAELPRLPVRRPRRTRRHFTPSRAPGNLGRNQRRSCPWQHRPGKPCLKNTTIASFSPPTSAGFFDPSPNLGTIVSTSH